MSDYSVPTPEEAKKGLEEMAAALGGEAGTVLPPSAIGIIQGIPHPDRPLTDQLYQTLLEQLPAVTFMTSFEEEKQRVYVSPQIETILGYTPAEWLESPSLWYERLHPEDRERWEKEFSATVMSKGTTVHSAYRFLHRDGRVVWILGDVRIRRDAATGAPLFVQALGFDITDLKRKEAELEAAKEELRRSNVHLRVQVRKEALEGLVGSSPPMEKLRAQIRPFVRSGTTVLITGESGSGKELVARALHYGGPRAKKPFVTINCAAITETLLDSELFGVDEGKITGVKGHRGKFEQAEGGTLLLDEIGDMSPALQTKVLRVLQEGKFQRVMGDKDISVDVRVVCATHRNLAEAIRKGTFREDLYYRINPIVIAVPPLRERLADVPELARHLLERKNQKEKRSVSISEEAVEILSGYAWPGNVRELQGAIDYAVDVCEGAEILPEHLPSGLLEKAPSPAAGGGNERLIDKLARLERVEIVAALEGNAWVKARAAKKLGMSDQTLTNRMNVLGIHKA